MKFRQIRRIGVNVGVIVVLVLLWQVVFSFHLLPERYSASPGAVVHRLVRERGVIFASAVISLTRLLAGVSLGLIVSQRRHLEEWVTPPIQLFAPIPIIIYAPFLVLFFGLGEPFKVVL